ncbi:MAG: Cytochrome c oxidase subunit 6B [Cyphobasidiales sp. Tagirdzhanova-0007]|nr:MAG: Cytochrome c oxidase subunit 6B [Cyphobasidiales sp. Tagirdzhanova-0007]
MLSLTPHLTDAHSLIQWQNYVDYFRCTAAKGEDFAPCKQSLPQLVPQCAPNLQIVSKKLLMKIGGGIPLPLADEWIARWDEQRDEGRFPSDLSP